MAIHSSVGLRSYCLVVLAGGAVAGLSTTAYSQGTASARNAPTATLRLSTDSTKSVHATLERSLGIRVPVAELYRRFRQPARSQFETSLAFSERTTRPVPGRYVVTVPRSCSRNDVWHTRYVADSGALRVVIRAFDPPEGDEPYMTGDHSERALFTQCTQNKSGAYRGVTALGVQTRVSTAAFTLYGLLVDASGWEFGLGSTRYIDMYVPMPPEQAKRVLPHIRLAVSFCIQSRPRAGPTAQRLDRSDPTLDVPSEQTFDERFVRARHAAFHLVDGRSGRVLGSTDAERNLPALEDASLVAQAHNAGTDLCAPPQTPGRSRDVYFESQVEKPVVLVSRNRIPSFPEVLKSQHVEGEVLAQFVVDTSGSVEMSSFKVLKSSHGLFTEAVRTWLQNARYFPAEEGGMRVKQLVQRSFVFGL